MKCQTQLELFFESIGMFGAAQGRPAIIIPASPGYRWPSKGRSGQLLCYLMWHLYVSKVQLCIKSIFASPKQLNNGLLLLPGTSWSQGEEEMLLGLLFGSRDPSGFPPAAEKMGGFWCIGQSDFMVPAGLLLLSAWGWSYCRGRGGKKKHLH